MSDVFHSLIAHPRAVAELRACARAPVHAYLFAGTTGTRDAAKSFAAAVLCADAGCGSCSTCMRVLGGTHPDVTVVERAGASIRAEEIDEVIRLSVRPPAEGDHKVIVLSEFHLVAQQSPRLLKTLEEPPATTVFIVLADDVPAELVTIASRCVRIDFGPVPDDVLIAALVADGVSEDRAMAVAAAAGGRAERARLLAEDDAFVARQTAWASIPDQLDGTGATIARVVDELLAAADSVLEPLSARQADELAALQERIERYGERGSGRKELEDRHRREQRRVRTDEVRFGLAALAGAYRDRLVQGSADPRSAAAAVDAIQRAGESLVRNPNEALLLQGLLSRLTDLSEGMPAR